MCAGSLNLVECRDLTRGRAPRSNALKHALPTTQLDQAAATPMMRTAHRCGADTNNAPERVRAAYLELVPHDRPPMVW
jgi:hypothetical protein